MIVAIFVVVVVDVAAVVVAIAVAVAIATVNYSFNNTNKNIQLKILAITPLCLVEFFILVFGFPGLTSKYNELLSDISTVYVILKVLDICLHMMLLYFIYITHFSLIVLSI